MFFGFTSRWKAALVCVVQCVGDLADDLQRLSLAVDLAVGQLVIDGAALDVLHHEEVEAVGLADVDGLHDVIVVEARRGPPFAVEALDELRVLAEAAREDFDCHNTVEADLPGAVDDGHRARPALVEQLVAGNLLGRAPARVLAGPLDAQELCPGQEAQVHQHFADRPAAGAADRAALLLLGRANFLGGGELALYHGTDDLAIFQTVRQLRCSCRAA